MTEYFSPERALSVRLSVCLCVCLSVTAFYLDTIRPILMKLGPHDLIKNLRWHFSQILKMLLRWRHGGHFVCLWMRHSHGRNFASIFFKIMDKEVWCLPMFAIENQLNRLITSGRKSGPRLQKIVSWFSSRCRRSVVRSPAGTKVLQLDSCYCCDNNWLLLYEKSKWLNILLTPWCSCLYFCTY